MNDSNLLRVWVILIGALLTGYTERFVCFRRCLHCSSGHCCNSWCKEEFVLIVQFIAFTVIYALMYLPLVRRMPLFRLIIMHCSAPSYDSCPTTAMAGAQEWLLPVLTKR